MTSIRVMRLAAATLLLVGFMVPAAAEEQGIELGILGGIVYLDESLAGSGGPTLEPTLGIRAGGPLPAGSFDWFADALYADIDTETFRLGARSIALRGGLEWRHPDMQAKPWFMTFGIGYHDISFDMATDYSSMFLSAGIGQKIGLGGKKTVPLGAARRSLAGRAMVWRARTSSSRKLLVGLSWELGRRRPERSRVRRRSRKTSEPPAGLKSPCP